MKNQKKKKVELPNRCLLRRPSGKLCSKRLRKGQHYCSRCRSEKNKVEISRLQENVIHFSEVISTTKNNDY